MSDIHPTPAKLQCLSMGRLTTVESLRLQRHLFRCSSCLRQLIEFEAVNEIAEKLYSHPLTPDRRKPLFVVHDTADGMIYSQSTRNGRKWIARHWGPQLDGMRICGTMREANEYLETSFSEMFPEHRCTERCQILAYPGAKGALAVTMPVLVVNVDKEPL
jgi:hypothetical protein